LKPSALSAGSLKMGTQQLTDTFTYGDYVTIGKNRLTWKIVGMKQVSGTYVLESGQTGKRIMVRPERLTMHTPADTTPKQIGGNSDNPQ